MQNRLLVSQFCTAEASVFSLMKHDAPPCLKVTDWVLAIDIYFFNLSVFHSVFCSYCMFLSVAT